MPTHTAVTVAPIGADQLADVGRFLHENLNRRVPAERWAEMAVPPWKVDAPNHGFLLRRDGVVVGAYLAIYSEREVRGQVERFCNLAAWCVLDDHRADGVRLLRALLRQKGYHFTDLSPSGNVVAINERLGFTRLDTTTALVPNARWSRASSRARIVSEPGEVESMLAGRDLEIFEDHRRAVAARQFLVVAGDAVCHVVVRKDRRKRLPLFASVLHVSDPEVFRQNDAAVFRHLLLHHGAAMTLAERRVLGYIPPFSRVLTSPRTKMYRSATLGPDDIDYLYSELTCVAW
jgi:hypothetical protein